MYVEMNEGMRTRRSSSFWRTSQADSAIVTTPSPFLLEGCKYETLLFGHEAPKNSCRLHYLDFGMALPRDVPQHDPLPKQHPASGGCPLTASITGRVVSQMESSLLLDFNGQISSSANGTMMTPLKNIFHSCRSA